MKFYTFNDKGNKSSVINILLDHNTTALVAWNHNRSDSNTMYEAEDALRNNTLNWKQYARLITADEVAKITSNKTFDSTKSDSYSWFYFDSNNQSFNLQGKSKYAWLYDYTYDCDSYYGCNESDNNRYKPYKLSGSSIIIGYWTSTKVYNGNSLNQENFAWVVRRTSSLYYYSIYSDGDFGVRPVITIPKTIIK